MSATAKLNYLRIAPRKVRLLADLIRGKMAKDAQTILSFVVKKSATPLLRLLNQAVANAQNNFQLDANNLYISKITVDEGPKLKRWRPRARGQTYEIQKKTSHITIVLAQKIKTKPKAMFVKVPVEEPKERIVRPEKPKPKPEIETIKPKIEKAEIKRIFRRKAF